MRRIIAMLSIIFILASCNEAPKGSDNNVGTDLQNIQFPRDESGEEPLEMTRTIVGTVATGRLLSEDDDIFRQNDEVILKDRNGTLLGTTTTDDQGQLVLDTVVTLTNYPLHAEVNADFRKLTNTIPYREESTHRMNVNEITTLIDEQQPRTETETIAAEKMVLEKRFGLDEQGEALFVDVFTQGSFEADYYLAPVLLQAAQNSGTDLYELPQGSSYLLDQNYLSALGNILQGFDDTDKAAFLDQIPSDAIVLKQGLTNIAYASSEELQEAYEQFLADFSEQQTYLVDPDLERILIIGPSEVWENTENDFTAELIQNSIRREVDVTWELSGEGASISDGMLQTEFLDEDKNIALQVRYSSTTSQELTGIKTVTIRNRPQVSKLTILGPDQLKAYSSALYQPQVHYDDGSIRIEDGEWSVSSSISVINEDGVLTILGKEPTSSVSIRVDYGGFSENKTILLLP